MAISLIAMALIAGCTLAGQRQMIVGSWLAADIGGRGVVDRAQSTIAFDGTGRVHGSGGCNSKSR